MIQVKVSEARAKMRELLARVERGEEVVLTQHGRVVAVLISPSKLRARARSSAVEVAEDLGLLLDEARATRPERGRGISKHRADELIGALRAGRKAR